MQSSMIIFFIKCEEEEKMPALISSRKLLVDSKPGKVDIKYYLLVGTENSHVMNQTLNSYKVL